MAKSVPTTRKTVLKSTLSRKVIENIRKKCPVIANGNAKGGVGKTTTAAHEIWHGVDLKLKVLAIDFDKHLTDVFFETSTPELPDYAVASDLFTSEGIQKPIYQVPGYENFYFLPADHNLKDVDGISFDQGVYEYPAQQIKTLREQFDLIIIDSPPSEGNRQQATLLSSTTTVLVSELNKISVNGVTDVLGITDSLISAINESYGYERYEMPDCIIVPNKYDSRRKRDKEFYEMLKSFDLNLTPLLPYRAPISAALSDAQPVWKYKDGNARMAAKEMKLVLDHIFTEVSK